MKELGYNDTGGTDSTMLSENKNMIAKILENILYGRSF